MSDEEYGSGDEYEEYDDDDGGVFGEEETSEHYKKLLEADIEALKEEGYRAGWSHHALELFVWVGIPPTFIDEEFASACGLALDRNIVCKITFDTPPSYMSSCPSVEGKSLMIRQSNDTDLNKSKLLDLQYFGLWWPLEQRLSVYLKQNWGSIVNKAKEAINKLGEGGEGDEVQQVIETTGVSKELAAFALSKCHKDVQQAIGMLLDESDQARLEKEMAKGKMQEKEVEKGDEEEEDQPGRESLLTDIVKFIKEAVKTSTASCIVCNKHHPLELLKPTVCDDALCNFQFVELGLGINVESDIIHNPDAVDMLVCFTVAATGGRHFLPFPSSVRSDKMVDGKITTIEFKENPGEIATVLNKLPPLSELQQLVLKGKLKDTLDELHPLLYKLLRWILGTNRAHLQKLRGNEKIKEFTTEMQFVMKSSPPATEKKFQLLKKEEGGSFYAFHGSPFSNWHSILRNGLKNYSNTANMTTGAVYGPGIYMAVDSGTSLGYTGYSAGSWANSAFGQNLKCMAVCEVIDHGESEPSKCKGGLHRPNCCHCTGAPYYRCEEEAYVCTRFLLLFKDGDSPNLQASSLTIPNSLKRSFKGIKSSKGVK